MQGLGLIMSPRVNSFYKALLHYHDEIITIFCHTWGRRNHSGAIKISVLTNRYSPRCRWLSLLTSCTRCIRNCCSLVTVEFRWVYVVTVNFSEVTVLFFHSDTHLSVPARFGALLRHQKSLHLPQTVPSTNFTRGHRLNKRSHFPTMRTEQVPTMNWLVT